MMNIATQLPEYSKELLRSLDPSHQLDLLECNICQNYFNLKERRPIIICKIKKCVEKHKICEFCLKNMIEVKEKDGVQQALQCPFCKELGYNEYRYDQSQNDLIAKLNNIIQMLQHISTNTKKLTEKQSQKKLKEVIDKAQKDIFTISTKEKEKTYLLDRLKKKIQQTTKQNQQIQKAVSAKEKQLQQEQQAFSATRKELMIKNRQYEIQMQEKNRLIEQLQQENKVFRERLSHYEDINSLQKKVNKRRRPEESSRPNAFFNQDSFYTQFKFHPLRNEQFTQNFNEKGPQTIIELKQQRQKYFNYVGSRKNLYHNKLFDYRNEEDRLICFRVKSHNKKVLMYKFGLADQHYQQVKNANLFINLGSVNEQKQPLIITFYVNVVKMRLYATTGTLRKSENIPGNIKLGKFTVFVHFFDMKTQLTAA